MSREFRLVLRVAGSNIDGTKKLVYGLTRIRGVGASYASAVVRAAELRPEARMGDLSEEEVQKLESVMRDPAKYGLPARLFNRRKGLDSGQDVHLIGADLALSTKSDIDFMTDIRSWKGIRHSLGLKVRWSTNSNHWPQRQSCRSREESCYGSSEGSSCRWREGRKEVEGMKDGRPKED